MQRFLQHADFRRAGLFVVLLRPRAGYRGGLIRVWFDENDHVPLWLWETAATEKAGICAYDSAPPSIACYHGALGRQSSGITLRV